MKLTIKVTIAFSILCGLMTAGGAFSYFNMNKIHDSFSFVMNEISELSDNANTIEQGLLRINKTASDMVFADKKAPLEQSFQEFNQQSNELKERINSLLAQLEKVNSTEQAATAQALQKTLSEITQIGQTLFNTRTSILKEATSIDKTKTDFLIKISFAKVALDLSFKEQADTDPFIASLIKQIITQIGTMEYMVNAVFSTQSLTEMQTIQKNSVAVSQMILKNSNTLLQEVPEAKNNSDLTTGISAFEENDGLTHGAVARYVALQDKRAELLKQMQNISNLVASGSIQGRTLRSAAKEIGNSAFAKANDSISSTSMSVLLTLLFSLPFAIIVGWRLSKSINSPMKVLQATLRHLSMGDFTNTVKGVFSGEFAELQRDINAVIYGFNQTLRTVRNGAEQTRETANKNREFASTLDAQVQVQSGTMNTLAATVTEMEHAIQDVNKSTSESLAMVLSVDEQVQSGRQLVNENNELVSSLFDKLRHSESEIKDVYTQSELIGSIVEVISSISEQTNLLALNAAIEAARAGEHGRGFAVVADEVRNLASRTNQSTKEINAMISELQKKSSGAVSSMQDSLVLMKDGQYKMEQVHDSINIISDHILHVRNSAELIANATQEQTIASREISRSINEMSEVVELSSKTMHDMAGQTNTLEQLCEEQEKTVSQFKLGAI